MRFVNDWSQQVPAYERQTALKLALSRYANQFKFQGPKQIRQE